MKELVAIVIGSCKAVPAYEAAVALDVRVAKG
jgi:hypothetical protein